MTEILDENVCELTEDDLDAVTGTGKNENSIVFAGVTPNGADLWNTFVGCAGVPQAAMKGFNVDAGGGCPK